MTNIFQTFINKMSGGQPDESSLENAALISNIITGFVGALRDTFPNEHIRELMVLVWDLFGKNVVPIAVYDRIPSLSFVVVGIKNKESRRGMVLVPTNWAETARQDPIGQAGGLVFVASQARDYYNGKLYGSEDSQETKDRALAYEAEYLLTALKEAPDDFELSQYQKDILSQFPEGVSTPEAQKLLYTSRKFSLEADA